MRKSGKKFNKVFFFSFFALEKMDIIVDCYFMKATGDKVTVGVY